MLASMSRRRAAAAGLAERATAWCTPRPWGRRAAARGACAARQAAPVLLHLEGRVRQLRFVRAVASAIRINCMLHARENGAVAGQHVPELRKKVV